MFESVCLCVVFLCLCAEFLCCCVVVLFDVSFLMMSISRPPLKASCSSPCNSIYKDEGIDLVRDD